jgi:2,3-bisphosphoglycerate-dependent phosphoglycerate mutase
MDTMNKKLDIAVFTRPFYYLRHGETESNAAGTIAGSLDVELTALGREQARIAARALERAPITGIYASPLRRARETAQPIAEALGLTVTILDEIAERNWGDLEGMPRHSHVRGEKPRGGESAETFMRRVLSGFALIDAAVPLIVAHSGVFRVLCRTLNIVEAEAPVANCLPLRFEPVADGWKVEDACAKGRD